jgi:hypothetical protein
MFTRSATTARAIGRDTTTVQTRGQLLRIGITPSGISAQLKARRWQRVGTAIVLHNGELTHEERWDAGVINCGPRAVLASFSAAERLGLKGWERDAIHVLAPAGVPRPHVPGLPIVLHRSGGIAPGAVFASRRIQRIAPALALAAASFASPRPGCGILAAGVQQRLTGADELRAVLQTATRIRHRRLLLAAVGDIEMGAQALSEIDFVRVCRKFRLPAPALQAVRVERSGRRRYLDAEWIRRDGKRVAVEVDGALHLSARRWWDDQLRQNEVVLSGTVMLRYPSAIIRTNEELVANQLRRALFV